MTWVVSNTGGYSNYFLTGCAVQGLKPLPISKRFFSCKRMTDFTVFQNFHKSGPISKGFLPPKWLILLFFQNFCEMGPSSKDFFWPKWDPCLRICGEKVTHLGGTSLFALMWVSPSWSNIVTVVTTYFVKLTNIPLPSQKLLKWLTSHLCVFWVRWYWPWCKYLFHLFSPLACFPPLLWQNQEKVNDVWCVCR